MKTMVDMKMSKADMEKEAPTAAGPGEREPYPYGLCLNLDKASLAKLGFSELPEVGEEFYIMAVGKVTNVNQSASENGDHSSMSIQITEMCVDNEPTHKGEKTETRKAESREKGAKTVLSNAYQGM